MSGRVPPPGTRADNKARRGDAFRRVGVAQRRPDLRLGLVERAFVGFVGLVEQIRVGEHEGLQRAAFDLEMSRRFCEVVGGAAQRAPDLLPRD